MVFPLRLTVAAALSVAIGWSAVRWIAQSEPRRVSPVVLEAQSSPERINATPASPAPSATSKERMAALAALVEKPHSMARDHALAAALLELKAKDFPATASEMLALLTQLQKTQQSTTEQLAEAWLDRWLELDRAGALRFLGDTPFLTQLPEPGLSGWPLDEQVHCALGGVLRALARHDREWTRQFVSELKEPGKREVGLFALLKEVTHRDPARARQLLANFKDEKDRRAVMTGYVTSLVNTDLHTSFDIAWAEPPGQMREDLLRLVFAHVGKRSISDVRAMLDRVDDPAVRARQAATALSAIAWEARENALDFVKEESERMAEGGWKAEYRNWANSIQVAARGAKAPAFAEWAGGFAPDKDRGMFAWILSEWSGRDPAALQSWLGTHAEMLDEAALSKLNTPLSSMARRDLAAVRSWSDTLPPGALRDQARFQVALASGTQSDLAYAEGAYRAVSANDTEGTLARQLASVLAGQDGAAAAEWAAQLPSGAARTAALLTVANTWSGRDPVGAAQWLQGMPAGADRDRAVSTYAKIVAVADSRAAVQWVEQVSDSSLRIQAANTVFTRWNMEDPVAARAWLRSLPGVDQRIVAGYLRDAR